MDVINGRGPAPSLVLSLIARLPDDSLTAALAVGERGWFGWTPERLLLSDIYDAINVNTKATGHWKKGKSPDFPPAVRPKLTGSATEDKRKSVSVRDLYKRFGKG